VSNDDIVLACQGIHHWFGDNKVLYDVNLDVVRGEILALVGPSGCGKSTLLRAILGTHPPRRGKVVVTHANGTSEEALRPGRDRGIVYQCYSLYPFLTARENVAIGLMFDQTSLPFRFFLYPQWRLMRRRHLEEAADLLETLKLADAIHRYPHEMSGGMCQRVAVAQALIMKPDVLLLDEPFGALDEATREELQRMLLTLYAENCQARRRGEPPPYTIIIVTHELNEAIYVGDRVVGLSQYWNWRTEGRDHCPGATIVYDQISPVYLPDEEPDYGSFFRQRTEIRHAAFDPAVLEKGDELRRFWQDVREGRGQGVLAASPGGEAAARRPEAATGAGR